MTSTPPGGWYPDPSGPPGLQRWWDGVRWTEHTHLTVCLPLPPAVGPPLVSYGRRLGSWLIDWLIVGVVSGVIIALSGAYSHTSTTTTYRRVASQYAGSTSTGRESPSKLPSLCSTACCCVVRSVVRQWA